MNLREAMVQVDNIRLRLSDDEVLLEQMSGTFVASKSPIKVSASHFDVLVETYLILRGAEIVDVGEEDEEEED